MSAGPENWFSKARWWLLAGGALWGLLGALSWAAARTSDKPVLPVLVTWDEWFVAVALILWVILAWVVPSPAREARSGRLRDRSAMTRGILSMILMVFLLDLVVRALFGLGWRPFL